MPDQSREIVFNAKMSERIYDDLRRMLAMIEEINRATSALSMTLPSNFAGMQDKVSSAFTMGDDQSTKDYVSGLGHLVGDAAKYVTRNGGTLTDEKITNMDLTGTSGVGPMSAGTAQTRREWNVSEGGDLGNAMIQSKLGLGLKGHDDLAQLIHAAISNPEGTIADKLRSVGPSLGIDAFNAGKESFQTGWRDTSMMSAPRVSRGVNDDTVIGYQREAAYKNASVPIEAERQAGLADEKNRRQAEAEEARVGRQAEAAEARNSKQAEAAAARSSKQAEAAEARSNKQAAAEESRSSKQAASELSAAQKEKSGFNDDATDAYVRTARKYDFKSAGRMAGRRELDDTTRPNGDPLSDEEKDSIASDGDEKLANGGNGARNSIGKLALTHLAGQQFIQLANTAVQKQAQGKDMRLYDYAPAAGSLGGMVAGGLVSWAAQTAVAAGVLTGGFAIPAIPAIMAGGLILGSAGDLWKGIEGGREGRLASAASMSSFLDPYDAHKLNKELDVRFGGAAWSTDQTASRSRSFFNLAAEYDDSHKAYTEMRKATGAMFHTDYQRDPSGALYNAHLKSLEDLSKNPNWSRTGDEYNEKDAALAYRIGGTEGVEFYDSSYDNKDGSAASKDKRKKVAIHAMNVERSILKAQLDEPYNTSLTAFATSDVAIARASGASAFDIMNGSGASQISALTSERAGRYITLDKMNARGIDPSDATGMAQVAAQVEAIHALTAMIATLQQSMGVAVSNQRLAENAVHGVGAASSSAIAAQGQGIGTTGEDIFGGTIANTLDRRRELQQSLRDSPNASPEQKMAWKSELAGMPATLAKLGQQRWSQDNLRPEDLEISKHAQESASRGVTISTTTNPLSVNAALAQSATADYADARTMAKESGYMADALDGNGIHRFSTEMIRKRRLEATTMRQQGTAMEAQSWMLGSSPYTAAVDSYSAGVGAYDIAAGHGSLAAASDYAANAANISLRSRQQNVVTMTALGYTTDPEKKASITATGADSQLEYRKKAIANATTAGEYHRTIAGQESMDELSWKIQMKQIYPFQEGNVANDQMAKLKMLGEDITGLDKQYKGLSKTYKGDDLKAAQHRLATDRRGLQLEQAQTMQALDEGWLGKVLEREYNAPSHGAMYAPTFRQVLENNPGAGRFFGSGSRAETASQREKGLVGSSGATAQPNNFGAQEMRLVVVIQDSKEGFDRGKQAEVRFQSGSDATQKVTIDRSGGR